MIELVRALVCLDLVRRADAPPAFIDAVDRLTFRSFPAKQRVVHVLMLLRCEEADVDQDHAIAVRLVGPDGTSEFPEMQTEFSCEGEAEGGTIHLTGSASFIGPTFIYPGGYEFRIELDGREVGRLPLVVESFAAA